MQDHSDGSGAAAGRHTKLALDFAGVRREVALLVPSSYTRDTPIPLVVALHGGSGDASVMYASDKRIVAHAQSDGFIAVFPNGLPKPDQPNSTNYFWGDPINISFMAFLLDALSARYTIDTARIYFIGFSGGAKLIYDLASDPAISARIAGIGTVAGAIGSRQLEPPMLPWEIIDPSVTGGTPMPAYLIQGKQDDHMPMAGGFDNEHEKMLVGFETKVTIWCAFTGALAETPITRALPTTVTARAWTNARSGHGLVAAVDDTLGHHWPHWDAMAAFWNFFQSMPPRTRRTSTSTERALAAAE